MNMPHAVGQLAAQAGFPGLLDDDTFELDVPLAQYGPQSGQQVRQALQSPMTDDERYQRPLCGPRRQSIRQLNGPFGQGCRQQAAGGAGENSAQGQVRRPIPIADDTWSLRRVEQSLVAVVEIHPGIAEPASQPGKTQHPRTARAVEQHRADSASQAWSHVRSIAAGGSSGVGFIDLADVRVSSRSSTSAHRARRIRSEPAQCQSPRHPFRRVVWRWSRLPSHESAASEATRRRNRCATCRDPAPCAYRLGQPIAKQAAQPPGGPCGRRGGQIQRDRRLKARHESLVPTAHAGLDAATFVGGPICLTPELRGPDGVLGQSRQIGREAPNVSNR